MWRTVLAVGLVAFAVIYYAFLVPRRRAYPVQRVMVAGPCPECEQPLEVGDYHACFDDDAAGTDVDEASVHA